jgi:hypothetical protein
MPLVASVDVGREPAIAQSLVDLLAPQTVRVVSEQRVDVLDKGAGTCWTTTTLENQIDVIGLDDQVVSYRHGSSPDSM